MDRHGLTKLMAGVASAVLALAPRLAAASAELDKARQTFESHLTKLEAARTAREKAWHDGYQEDLDKLAAAVQKRGDLDAWQAAVRERDRFKTAGSLSDEHVVPTPEALRALQQQYLKKSHEESLASNKDVLALADLYARRLEDMQKKFVQAGGLDDALACREEASRVKSRPDITAAQFDISAAEAQAAPDAAQKEPATDADTTPAPQAGPKPAGAAGKPEPREVDGCLVNAGPAPNIEGVFMKSLALRPTARARTANRVSVRAESGDLSKVTSRNSGLGYYLSAYWGGHNKSQSEDSMVRIATRTSDPVAQVSVVIQLFTKPASTRGNVTPQRAAIYRIPLETLGSEGVTVDCPPISTSKNRSRYSYYGSADKSGQDFYGAGVSVFDAQGRVLFEGASAPALLPLVETTDPKASREEQIDNLRTDYQELQRRYNQMSSDSNVPAAEREKARLAFEKARDAYYAAQNQK